MRKFTKTKVGEYPNTRWMITDYFEANNQKELMEIYLAESNPMKRGNPPITGGPIIGYFIDEKDAQDYCNYRNRKLSKSLIVKPSYSPNPVIIKQGNWNNI